MGKLMSNPPLPQASGDWSCAGPVIHLNETANWPVPSFMVRLGIAGSIYVQSPALAILEIPARTNTLPSVANFCSSDIEAIACYLVENFCKKFGALRDAEAFDRFRYLQLQLNQVTGNNLKLNKISVSASKVNGKLTCEESGVPFATDFYRKPMLLGRMKCIV